MAYLISDMAAGSDAALKLQQNMAAAPYVQEQQQNAMLNDAMKLEQNRATLDRQRLADEMAGVRLKNDKDAKAKMTAYEQSPEYKDSDDVQRLTKTAQFAFEAGQFEEGGKILTAAETLAGKRIVNDQKKLDLQAQELGNTYAAIAPLTPEKAAATFERLPQANKDLVYSRVGGADNWNNFTPKEKQDTLLGLMENAKGQLGTRLKELDLEKTRMTLASQERRATIQAQTRLSLRANGGLSDREMRDWGIYDKGRQTLENSTTKGMAELDIRVQEAEAALKATTFFSSKEERALEDARAERDLFMIKSIKKQMSHAASAPPFAGKDTVLDSLRTELELYEDTGGEENPKPSPKPAVVPSNKVDQEAAAWANANPNDPRAAKILAKQGATLMPAAPAASSPGNTKFKELMERKALAKKLADGTATRPERARALELGVK